MSTTDSTTDDGSEEQTPQEKAAEFVERNEREVRELAKRDGVVGALARAYLEVAEEGSDDAE